AAALFQRAERVLGRVDGFVLLVESLPARFDGAADGLEALVSGGVAAGSLRRRGRAVRQQREAGGAAHRDVEKVGTRGRVFGNGKHGRCHGGGGRGHAGSDRFRPSIDETGHDDGAAQARAWKRRVPRQRSLALTRATEKGDQMNFYAPGAGQRDDGVRVEQDGRSMEAFEAADAAETMEAVQVQSTGLVKVESQQVASSDAGSANQRQGEQQRRRPVGSV
uniref:Uncharacterized protein n=1 Tax=Setaria italica TaxID=4555 RepID=K3YCC6_SETIT